MSLNGTYELKSYDNYDGWLKAVGVPDAIAAKLSSEKHKLEVSLVKDGLSVKTIAGEKVFDNSFVFGKDSDADVAGLKYKMNVTINSKGFGGVVKLGGKSSTVTVEVDDAGFKETMTVDGVTGGKTYTRV